MLIKGDKKVPGARRRSVLETMMRFTPAAVSLAVLLAVTSSVTVGQKPTAVDARSLAWSERGTSAFAAKQYDAATDAFETALALDTRNRAAFLGLAQVADAQQLPGKAIRYYDEALQLDPTDARALKAQGVAMLEKGAIESARGNLAKIKSNCRTRCEAADELAAAIARNPAGTRIVSSTAAAPMQGGTPVKE